MLLASISSNGFDGLCLAGCGSCTPCNFDLPFRISHPFLLELYVTVTSQKLTLINPQCTNLKVGNKLHIREWKPVPTRSGLGCQAMLASLSARPSP